MTGPHLRLGALALATASLTACTVGPHYRAPDLTAPPTWADAASTSRIAVNFSEADLSRWWTQFGDAELDALITRALAGNYDLKTAASRVRAAREQEIIQAAAEAPTISAAGNAATLNSNRGSGAATAGSTGGGAGGVKIPSHANLYSLGFDATWEIDLFGGVRRGVEEARANTEAQVWARRDGEVSLTAEVANDYLTLRALQARIAVGEAELQRQRDLRVIVSQRQRTGFVTDLDVEQQNSAVATAAAQIPQLQAQARGEIHALGVLLGETPEALSDELAAANPPIPPPPPTLPLGLPSDLLRRRPDVREAERRLAAANAEIGVRTAAEYPKLDLYALASLASTSTTAFFSQQNLSSAALGMLSQPLFDAGRRRAQVRAAREQYVQADYAWRSTVLGAFRDVEDALARYRSEETRRENLARAVEAARNSLTIARQQYQTGFVTFINVLQAQNAELNAEDQLTQSDALVASDVVSLYKALGGGWSS